MKSIAARFRVQCATNPNLGSLICYTRAIKGQGYTKRFISKWFNTLVERGDYSLKDKKTLILWLVQASNTVGAQNKGKEALRAVEIRNAVRELVASAKVPPACKVV